MKDWMWKIAVLSGLIKKKKETQGDRIGWVRVGSKMADRETKSQVSEIGNENGKWNLQ